MANRSNRRQSNPVMSRYSKHVQAIGNWRANNPLWPGINVCQLKRPDIRMQSCHVCHQQLACKKEESIYGHSRTAAYGRACVKTPKFCLVAKFFPTWLVPVMQCWGMVGMARLFGTNNTIVVPLRKMDLSFHTGSAILSLSRRQFPD